MQSFHDELFELRNRCDNARRDCDMNTVIEATRQIDYLIRNQPKEIR